MGISEGQNLFEKSAGEIKKILLSNSFVESVEVKKSLSGKVDISIKERIEKFIITYENSYIYIDSRRICS